MPNCWDSPLLDYADTNYATLAHGLTLPGQVILDGLEFLIWPRAFSCPWCHGVGVNETQPNGVRIGNLEQLAECPMLHQIANISLVSAHCAPGRKLLIKLTPSQTLVC